MQEYMAHETLSRRWTSISLKEVRLAKRLTLNGTQRWSPPRHFFRDPQQSALAQRR